MTEEMIDILDAHGVQTGVVKSKKVVHQQGLWHRTVHLWIITPDGKLLLQRCGPNMDTQPNCWDISSAGHISAGESSLNGAERELEELGLHITANQLECLGTIHGKKSIHQNGTYINCEYQDVFLIVRDISVKELQMQRSEVSELQLMPWPVLKQKVMTDDPDFVPHQEEYQLLFSVLAKRFLNANPR